ncbi:hypothetical protein EDC04DRAFT_2618344 [Pisolithus marmoratus]|nr:hypothetical protein EDC04DRAFT_2618344 [Pisolithus marmoratus]
MEGKFYCGQLTVNLNTEDYSTKPTNTVSTLLKAIGSPMDDLPKLTDNGHNWPTHGSWVLNAIADEGLMGLLVGSETQPIHLAQLRASWLAAEEAMRQSRSQPKQSAAGESAQSIYNSHIKKPENPPSKEDSSLDSPNNCAKTESGYLTPESEVINVQQVENNLPADEAQFVDGKWLGKHTNILEAPDKGSQHASNKIEESWDLPGLSSKALEPEGDLPFTTSEHAKTQTGHTKPKTEVVDVQQVVDVLPMFEGGTAGQTWHDKHVKEHEATDKGQHVEDEVVENRDSPGWRSEASKPADNSTSQGCRHPAENGPQTFVEHNECIQTNSEMITDVPDPPGIHAELPNPYVECTMLHDKLLTRMNSAMSTELERHGTAVIPQVLPMEAGRWGDSGSGDATSSNAICSHGAEKRLLADSRGQHSRRGVKWQDGLPAPPEPPPAGIIEHLPRLYKVTPGTHRHARIKTRAKTVSNVCTRQNAYCTHVPTMRPPQFILMSTELFKTVMEVTWMGRVHYDPVRSTENAQMRGYTHHAPGVAIRKRHMHQGCAIAIQSLRLLSMPAKSPRIMAGGSRIIDVRYDEASIIENVQMEGITHPSDHTHGNPTISPSREPGKRQKPPWDISSTYQRQGVPHPSIWGDDEPLYGQNGSLTIIVQGQSKVPLLNRPPTCHMTNT